MCDELITGQLTLSLIIKHLRLAETDNPTFFSNDKLYGKPLFQVSIWKKRRKSSRMKKDAHFQEKVDIVNGVPGCCVLIQGW